MSSKYTQQAETDLNGENKKVETALLVLMHYCRMVQSTTIFIGMGLEKNPGTTTLENYPLPDTKYLTPGNLYLQVE